jgi:hypothetical protein
VVSLSEAQVLQSPGAGGFAQMFLNSKRCIFPDEMNGRDIVKNE